MKQHHFSLTQKAYTLIRGVHTFMSFLPRFFAVTYFKTKIRFFSPQFFKCDLLGEGTLEQSPAGSASVQSEAVLCRRVCSLATIPPSVPVPES